MRPILPLLAALVACSDPPPEAGAFTPAEPIEGQEPIPYPADLFIQRVEGEVMLYLVIDTSGTVIRDSTRIANSSGHTAFDAAALVAANTLKFRPAHRGDTVVVAPLQVPIKFILPDSLRPAKDSS